jgi:hypothetical protein
LLHAPVSIADPSMPRMNRTETRDRARNWLVTRNLPDMTQMRNYKNDRTCD